jgi:hypothetical protein
MQIDRIDLGKAVAETDFEKNIEKSFQRLMDQLVQALNLGLLFSDNFDADIISSTIGGGDTEIPHTLKRVPSGYLILSRDQAGIVFDGVTAWTSSSIYVKASVPNLKVKIMIF